MGQGFYNKCQYHYKEIGCEKNVFTHQFAQHSYAMCRCRRSCCAGNTYPQSPLRQARNDAKKVRDTLNAIGFKVIRSYDANRNAMDDALSEFGQAASSACELCE